MSGFCPLFYNPLQNCIFLASFCAFREIVEKLAEPWNFYQKKWGTVTIKRIPSSVLETLRHGKRKFSRHNDIKVLYVIWHSHKK